MNSWMIKETEWGRWYPSMTATEINPDFSKIISTEADLPKPHDKRWIPHWSWDLSLSHRLHPFTPTCVYGWWLQSPYIPGILHLLQKGDQVQLRDKPCSLEKGIFVLLEIHQYRIQYVFRWDENAFSSRKWFPEILYSKLLYNTNTHLTIRSWDSGQVVLKQK